MRERKGAAPILLAAITWSATLLLVSGPAARADEGVYRDLIQRSLASLQEAERWAGQGRARAARETAVRARRLLEQAEGVRPRSPEVAFLAVQASVFAEDLPGARTWLERYRRRTAYGERDANLHFARALIAFHLESRPDLAIASLDRMRQAAPGTSPRARDALLYRALLEEGGRLGRAEQAAGALGVLQRAVRLARTLGDKRRELAARANVGITYQALGRHAESEAVFRRLLAEDADSPLWPWHLGRSLARQGRFGDAEPHYRRVVEMLDAGRIPPGRRAMLSEALLRLGQCERSLAGGEEDPARRRSRLSAARRLMERYVKSEPRSVAGRYGLGALLYEEFRLPYEAARHLEAAYELDPVCDASLRLLVRIASEHGPAPTEDPEDMASARAAWSRRRNAWQKDLEEHEEARKAERARRRARRLDGTDGCE